MEFHIKFFTLWTKVYTSLGQAVLCYKFRTYRIRPSKLQNWQILCSVIWKPNLTLTSRSGAS